MAINLSFLKDIDFTKPSNLLFFAIFLVIAVFVFFIFLYILAKIIKFIKKISARIFRIKKQDQREDQLEYANENYRPSQKVAGGDFIESEKKDSNQINNNELHGKDSEEYNFQKIKIPVAKNFSVEKSFSKTEEKEKKIGQNIESPGVIKADLKWWKKLPGFFKKKKEDQDAEEDQELKKISTGPDFLQDELRWQSKASEKLREEMKSKRSEKLDELVQKITKAKKAFAPKQERAHQQQDSSIFGGKKEVSRASLRQKLRTDPKIWQAQTQAGLNLTPMERVKLEKEVFSEALGSNISKTDLKWGIQKLNQKYLNAKDPAEKAKLRKEIKFVKKIGGIK